MKKTIVRWRFVSDSGLGWTCWLLNGKRIIVVDPKKNPHKEDLDARVLHAIAREHGPRRRVVSV